MSDPFFRPTNSDFLNALNATKFQDVALRPTGYELIYSSASDPQFASNGLSANAYLNAATGQIITAVEWKSGTNMRIVDIVAPFGGEAEMRGQIDKEKQKSC